MEKVNKKLVQQLIEGDISMDDSNSLLRMNPKDPERFWTYLEALQDRVSWPDKILLRISDHLYIVRNEQKQRVVKCDCGHELGDYRENWKTECQIRIKTTLKEFEQVYYPAAAAPEPEYNEIREFFCPGCYAQLAVDITPPGYPLVFEVFPDLDRFYRDFLGQPLDDENSDWFQDNTAQKLAAWL